MKHLMKLFVVAACLTPVLSVNAQTLLSDFSSSSGWGSSSTLIGTGGSYGISGGVANFTVSGPTESDFAYIRFNGAVGSYTSDWSVRIDVNFTTPANIFTGGVEQFLNLGLMVARSDVTPGVSSGEPTFNAFLVESNLYQNASNVRSRDIRTAVFASGSAADDATRYLEESLITAATATALQISCNATTHVLTASFDADGANNGYSFADISTLTADAGTWSMTGGNTFSIYLMGNAGYDGGATGLGPTISTGEATLDAFYGTGLTAVPEPSTYAAIAGGLALGLALWRRRRPASS